MMAVVLALVFGLVSGACVYHWHAKVKVEERRLRARFREIEGRH